MPVSKEKRNSKQIKPYLFNDEYIIIEKRCEIGNKHLYNAKSTKNDQDWLIKQYIIEDQEEYLELESLIPA